MLRDFRNGRPVPLLPLRDGLPRGYNYRPGDTPTTLKNTLHFRPVEFALLVHLLVGSLDGRGVNCPSSRTWQDATAI